MAVHRLALLVVQNETGLLHYGALADCDIQVYGTVMQKPSVCKAAGSNPMRGTAKMTTTLPVSASRWHISGLERPA